MKVGVDDGKPDGERDGSASSIVGSRVGKRVGCFVIVVGASVGVGSSVGIELGAEGSGVGEVGVGINVGAHEYSSAQQRAWYLSETDFAAHSSAGAAPVLPICTRNSFHDDVVHRVLVQIRAVSREHPDPFASLFSSSSSVHNLAPDPSQKFFASTHDIAPLQPIPAPKSLLPPQTPSLPRIIFVKSSSSVQVF